MDNELRDKLVELFDVTSFEFEDAVTLANYLIRNGVIIPIRCKDCKHCGVLKHNGKRYCKNPMGCLGCTPTESDNFCSYGERKDND